MKNTCYVRNCKNIVYKNGECLEHFNGGGSLPPDTKKRKPKKIEFKITRLTKRRFVRDDSLIKYNKKIIQRYCKMDRLKIDRQNYWKVECKCGCVFKIREMINEYQLNKIICKNCNTKGKLKIIDSVFLDG